MAISFQSDEEVLRKLRDKSRKMTDEELIRFGKEVRRLAEQKGAGVGTYMKRVSIFTGAPDNLMFVSRHSYLWWLISTRVGRKHLLLRIFRALLWPISRIFRVVSTKKGN